MSKFVKNTQNDLGGDCLVGHHILTHRFTDNHYQGFILHDLPKLLEDVPMAVTAQMWYVHDSAPPSFTHAVRDVLRNAYHKAAP
jgi:hypothetical protein